MENKTTLRVQRNGFVTGRTKSYEFTAQVFDEGSEFGINGGRVSRLRLCQNGKPVVVYDRGWELEAQDRPDMAAYLTVLASLESLPAMQALC